MGKIPTMSINKTDGCHVYLSSDSLDCEIVTAKSSEMNVLVPNKDGEFVSFLSGMKLKTYVILFYMKVSRFTMTFLSLVSPLRRRSLFPSSLRPSGTARSLLPLQQRSPDREEACKTAAPLRHHPLPFSQLPT